MPSYHTGNKISIYSTVSDAHTHAQVLDAEARIFLYENFLSDGEAKALLIPVAMHTLAYAELLICHLHSSICPLTLHLIASIPYYPWQRSATTSLRSAGGTCPALELLSPRVALPSPRSEPPRACSSTEARTMWSSPSRSALPSGPSCQWETERGYKSSSTTPPKRYRV